MASKIFREYKDKIRSYCDKNNLCFDRLRASPCCYDDEELIILRNERNPEREKLGLMDDIPIPATLEIYLENGNLRFVQTDLTHKYLGVGGDMKGRTVVKRASVREPALA